MNKISRFITKLINREPLTNIEAEEAMAIMVKGCANPSQIATYMTALKMQEITSSIIVGSVNYFSRVIQPKNTQNNLYTISFASSDSFMISVETTISLILSMFNMSIIKNFSSKPPISSTITAIKAASYNFDFTAIEICEILQKNNIVFTESKNFYPKMTDLDYVCNSLEFLTIMNFIFPLIQQYSLSGLIASATNYNQAITLAKSLQSLSYKHAIIFYNDIGANYFCPGINNIITLSDNDINQSIILLPDNPHINFKEENSFSLKNENLLFANDDLNFIEFTSFNSAALMTILKIYPNFDDAYIATKTIFDNYSIIDTLYNLINQTNTFLKKN